MAYKNPEDRRAYDREWHKKNSARRTKIQLDRRKEIIRWFREEVKPNYSCAHCGESDPIVIDFHHNEPKLKLFALATLLKNGYGKETILAELEKCTALCANCHRREEHRRRNTPT